MGKYKDLTGLKFGRLTALYRNKINGKIKWACKCDCGNDNIVFVFTSNLTTNHTQSCGCLQPEVASLFNKEYNTYDLSGEYGIGYASKKEEFCFDLDDYEKIKEYCWHKDNYGRITCRYKKHTYYLHRLIMNISDNTIIDHINRNPSDNRKENLRTCTSSQNNMNSNISIFNTSGFVGVSYSKQNKKWFSSIYKKRKRIHLGAFDNINDAIISRLQAEKKYYGEFAPQKHLFETYNIQ